MKNRLFPCLRRRTRAVGRPSRVASSFQQALLAGLLLGSASIAGAQTTLFSGVVERGADFAVVRRVGPAKDAAGATILRTNQFTLLENGLHYLANGRWQVSEDLVEAAPGGAVATRGPNRAAFSPDLNAPAVFAIQTPNGQRLAGGVRAIRLADVVSGRSVVLATVKASAPGQLLPPNRIVYPDAFDGFRADVLLTWQHNAFSQDVLLRERPMLPAGMDPDTTRLEIVTELVEAPMPARRTQRVQVGKAGDMDDDVVIGCGGLDFVMGQAFPVTNDVAWAVGGLDPTDHGSPVLKQWRVLPDGRTFLVESIGWNDAQPQWQTLPAPGHAGIAPAVHDATDVAALWPGRPKPLAKVKPMEVARAGYRPQGYVVDFVLLSGGTPTTLAANTTYYIQTSYYGGGPVTFQPGCVVKYKNNAYLLLYGSVSFPAAGQTRPVFTSRNDNGYGDVIEGVSGETDSDGNAALHRAAKALWIYYVNYGTTIQDVWIRWAQTGLRYDSNGGVCPGHILRDSRFTSCPTAVSLNFGSCGSTVLSLSNVTQCQSGGVTGYGPYSGSLIDDCYVASTALVNTPADDLSSGDTNKNSQSECSFVVVDSSKIVAAFFDTHLSEYGLGQQNFPGIVSPRSTGWAVSVNGGASFTDQGAIPPTVPASTTEGDAGDPVLARDTASGTIYLLANPSREAVTWKGFRLWKSVDNGQSFSLIQTDLFNGVADRGDKDMIVVNNFSGLGNSGHLYAAGGSQVGNQVWVAHSADGGATWDGIHNLSTPATSWSPDIAIRPNGAVYVFYLTWTDAGGGNLTNSIAYKWLNPGQTTWNNPAGVGLFQAHPDSAPLYSTKFYASGEPLRSKTATADDFFISNGFPRVAVNPVNGHIYVVFADLPFAGSTNDHGDIFISEGIPGRDNSLTWSGTRKVNTDATATDQWNPAIAVNPAGTQLFVGYYSRQDDSNHNALIKAYGAKANLAHGFATATFDVFPISPTAFAPLFPGTVASTPPENFWLYDPVWPQKNVCLDTDATVVKPCNPQEWQIMQKLVSGTAYQHFMADDYTWASADGTYFYYAWCDRSLPYNSEGHTRPDANIRLGKIKQ